MLHPYKKDGRAASRCQTEHGTEQAATNITVLHGPVEIRFELSEKRRAWHRELERQRKPTAAELIGAGLERVGHGVKRARRGVRRAATDK